MAVLIVRIIGIIAALFGGIRLVLSLQAPSSTEQLLSAALILIIGLATIIYSILVPKSREGMKPIENCLGYKLWTDANGDIVITCPRDDAEAKLHRGEVNFDGYVELVSQLEYAVKGDSRRARLAREHNDTTLLSSEYADELEALANDIAALKGSYDAGEIDISEYEKKLGELR